jgi:hypothetical protein
MAAVPTFLPIRAVLTVSPIPKPSGSFSSPDWWEQGEPSTLQMAVALDENRIAPALGRNLLVQTPIPWK